jgi:hypothetical protein
MKIKIYFLAGYDLQSGEARKQVDKNVLIFLGNKICRSFFALIVSHFIFLFSLFDSIPFQNIFFYLFVRCETTMSVSSKFCLMVTETLWRVQV